MRILAIRGRNLTALAGEFEVDFEDGPLSGAGLFAITGPTGAGKSTLLDALCVALYDRFPRLENAAKVAIGQAGADASLHVTGTDPRTILRHGEAEGYAEVDFAGRDGGRYRARWQVRRARNKASGRLQNQEMSLTDLETGQQIGSTKTEVLAEIAARTGLTFEQFRRSVLLAQGDFDAFLKARPADRADLLELMTGTEIYGALSVAAFERHKREREALDALDAQRRALDLLTPEDREAAARAAQAAEADARAARQALDGLRAQQTWYAEARTRREAVTAAEQALADAEDARQQAAPRREELATLRRLERLRPMVDEADRLTADHERLSGEAGAAETRCRDAEAARDAAQARGKQARAALDAAEKAFKDAGPDLDAAAALDSRIEGAEQHVSRCTATRDAAAARRKEAEDALSSRKDARARAEATARDAETWLSDHDSHRPLAEQVDRWIGEIEDWADADSALSAAEKQARELAERHATLTANHRKRAARLEDTEAAIAEGEAALQPIAERLEALDPAALEDRRARAAARADAVGELARLAGLADDLAERKAAHEARAEAARKRRAQADNALAEMEARRGLLDQRLSEAQRALDLSEAAADEAAAKLRGLLVDGKPCPVCGSEEHPLTHSETALDALAREQRDRVEALRADTRTLDATQRQADIDRASADEALNACAEEERRLKREVAQLAESWSDARSRAHGLSLPATAAEADHAALADQSAEAARAREAAEQDMAEAARLRGEADRRARHLGSLRLTRDQERDALSGLEKNLADAEARREAAEREAVRAAKARDSAEVALEDALAPLPDWRTEARAGWQTLADRCRSLADAFTDRRRALEDARQALDRLDADIRAAEADAANRRDALDTAQSSLEEAAGEHERLRAERAKLFEGEPTASVRSRLNGARLSAQSDLDAAQKAAAEAAAECSAAVSARDVLRKRLADTAEARDRALAGRDTALAEAGATLEEARTALAKGEDAVAALEAHLKEVDTAVTTARAVLDDRRRALDAHHQTPAPETPEEDLAAQVDERRLACDTAQEAAARERARLAHDAAQRDKGRDLEDRMAEQRQVTDLWATMQDLIGSAKGDKFRRFAQSLTLDRLLGMANAHLADLTPRYVLQRAPGGELDLQVIDREMGDEVRGVGSLSGGERFLVSLALALGLASMSGERALVESLFIDEGFGALDADSLDVAISALEALQATGRKVGVISHVQAMVDRIGVQVRVAKAGGGRSVVETVAA
ncbi:AAA family ATPase [Caenispirillum salinarum]|uniref:AAA family ATPase n=1 Tax=Caenispirillum salinarum TaxID=859058 RepID=UPI00384D443F